jgi:hypothetical protein
VLTIRKTGHSKKPSSLYNQHYDPSKKAGKRQCYISRQNIALLELSDRRYKKLYKPIIKTIVNMSKEETPPVDQGVELIAKAESLLREMGWPDSVVPVMEKVRADLTEINVIEVVKRYREERGKIKTREEVYKRHFKKASHKMSDEEKKNWEKVAKEGRDTLRGKRPAGGRSASDSS